MEADRNYGVPRSLYIYFFNILHVNASGYTPSQAY